MSSTTTWACEIDVDGDTSYEYFVGFFAGASFSVGTQTWYIVARTLTSDDIAEVFLHSHDVSFRQIQQTTIGPTTN